VAQGQVAAVLDHGRLVILSRPGPARSGGDEPGFEAIKGRPGNH